MRSRFVSSVSHELKTPLTAIRMFAETLALGRSHRRQARTEYLQTIVNESERLSRLVDNVLDFSRIEEGKRIYRMQPTCRWPTSFGPRRERWNIRSCSRVSPARRYG